MDDQDQLSTGDKIADRIASIVGSWKFVIFQTVLITGWVGFNFYGYIHKWDPYPFILLNLFLSFQAAYTAPILMMSQNRMEDKDRQRAIKDYDTDIRAEQEIKELHTKIDQLIKLVEELKTSR